jgi:hypothetical protein
MVLGLKPKKFRIPAPTVNVQN